MKKSLKESCDAFSPTIPNPSSSEIKISLIVPECPVSPNQWIGKKFAKHNETKRWERNISYAISMLFSTPSTEKNLMRTIEDTSSNLYKMLASTLAWHRTIPISRRKPRKGWTQITLIFRKA